MREPLKKLLYKWINNRYDRNEATDEVISLICKEIKKVENPYHMVEGLVEMPSSPRDASFEECRQKILFLLGGKDEEQELADLRHNASDDTIG